MRICIVIPAYNEEKDITAVVRGLKAHNLDIVVIDDGSRDQTAVLAEKAGAVVLRHRKNEGKGRGLKTGFDYCLSRNYDALITCDGDGQHAAEEVDKFVEKFKNSDAAIVIGNRMHNPQGMPLIRYLTNVFTSKVISLVTGSKIEDSQCGFRLIKVELLKKLLLSTNKYDLESEILLQAARLGYKIESVPISSIYSGQASQIHPIIDTYRFLRLIIKNAFTRRRGE